MVPLVLRLGGAMTESTLFNAAAQAAEEESRLAGNPPTPLTVDSAGQLPNPEGYTPTEMVEVQTPVELAPHGDLQELELTAAIPLGPTPAVIPVEAGLGTDVLPEPGLAMAAAAMAAEVPPAELIRPPALDLGGEPPLPAPIPTDGPPDPQPTPQPTPEPEPQPQPEPVPVPVPEPLPVPPVDEWPPLTPGNGGGGSEPPLPPPEPPPPEPPPPEPPPPEPPPPEPEPIEGRWKIDQTPAAGDKTGGDVIWENPEHGQKADTFFDVSFNQGSLKLDEGQRVQVFLDVYHQSGDANLTTAEPEDWSYAASGRDPHLPVVGSEINAAGQLVVTLEAAKDGVNLTGDVFRVEVSAVNDSEPEGHEQLVFDINDTIPAIDVSSGATIGANWDAHDDLLISIEENPSELPGPLALLPLGDLVEAFELQQQQLDRPTTGLSLDLAIPASMHQQGPDDQSPDGSELGDLLALDEPDQLPEDQIEHASDGAGISLEDRGGLSDVWNRLS